MTTSFIQDVRSQIDVPTDGTLSRVLHSDDQLRLVAFGFDTGQELTEHSSARPIVVQVVSGSIDFTVGDATHTMGTGSWMKLAPNVDHSLAAKKPSIVLLTLLPGAS